MRVAAAALLAMHAILAWMLRVPGLTTEHDDAWYLLLARALRQFSYAELPIVGTPPHAMYPPGYPALLALLGATNADAIALAVAVNVALSVLSLALAARLAARISPWYAIGVLAICAPNPLLLNQAAGVRSEVLYTVAALTALLAFTSPHTNTHTNTRTSTRIAMVGIAGVVLAALTRSIGVTLLLAMALHLVLARRWRTLTQLSLVAMLTVGAWMFWTVRAPRLAVGRSYIADATLVHSAREGDLAVVPATYGPLTPVIAIARIAPRRIAHNVQGYVRSFVPAAFAAPLLAGTGIDNGIWFLLLIVGGAVGLGCLWRSMRAVVLYLLAYLGLLAVWPYLMTRYLGPVLPLLALSMLVGVRCIIVRGVPQRLASARTVASVATTVAVAIVAVLSLNGTMQDVERLKLVAKCDRSAPIASAGCFGAEQRDFFVAIDAARRLTPDSARFLGAKDATFFLLTGRQSARESEAVATSDPAEFAEFLRMHGVQFILLSRVHIDQAAFAAPLTPYCAQYELVARFGAHVVLLRVPQSGATPDAEVGARACDAIAAWANGDWTDTNGPLW